MLKTELYKLIESLPDEELYTVLTDLLYIQKQYQFKQAILGKGVEMIEIAPYEADEIRDRWDNIFAKNVPKDERDSIHYEQFKWHIFSYEKQECLAYNEARKAFDEINKDTIYIMYQNNPDMFLYKNAQDLLSVDFDSQDDIYIFDSNFTWTYVHTHEEMCGPYFYKLN